MPSWHDIVSLDQQLAVQERCEGLDESKQSIVGLIDKEIASGIAPERIIVAGFSQGGAIALTTGMTYPKKLGGVISMSGYLPRPAEFAIHACQVNTPVLFCHGDSDDVVRLDWGRKSAERLKQLGATNIEFKVYRGMPHSACAEEVVDVAAFVRKIVG